MSDSVSEPNWQRRPSWQRLPQALRSWALLFFVLGWLPGVVLASWLMHAGKTFKLGKELSVTLTQSERYVSLLAGLASLTALAVGYAAVLRMRRRSNPGLDAQSCFRSLNRQLLWIVALPFIGILYTTRFESSHPELNLSLIAITVAIVCTWFYGISSPSPELAAFPASPPWDGATASRWDKLGPWLLVVAMGCVYGLRLSHLSVLDHRTFQTDNFDLGIYHNIFWNSTHGDFLGCSFCRGGKHYSAHFDPILWILSPIYRLSPRAETLLQLQSWWLALGGVPLFLYARRCLGHAWWACAVVAAYYLTPALQGANMYDFHSLTLLVPTAIWMVYCLDADKPWGYAAGFALLLLTREDMALLACFIGLYAILTGHKKLGAVTIAVSLVYFAVVKGIVMSPGRNLPSDTKAHSYTWYYGEMIPHRQEGAAGLIVTALSDPMATLLVLLSKQKLLYAIKLLLPLLFLPLFGGKKRVLMLYGLAFIGLASRDAVYSTHFQYSCLLIPFLLLSVPDAVVGLGKSRWPDLWGLDRGRLQKAALAAVVVSSALMSAEYGVAAQNSSIRAGYNNVTWSASEQQRARLESFRIFERQIPRDAVVSSTRHLGPHLADRAKIHQWPTVGNAEYILLDGSAKRHAKYGKILKMKMFEVIAESPDFVLLRRVEQGSDAGRRPSPESERRRPNTAP